VFVFNKSLNIPKDQWESVQKDKQGSTKHTHKTKDRVTRTPLKTGAPEEWSVPAPLVAHVVLL
jgi:hypothetical protein